MSVYDYLPTYLPQVVVDTRDFCEIPVLTFSPGLDGTIPHSMGSPDFRYPSRRNWLDRMLHVHQHLSRRYLSHLRSQCARREYRVAVYSRRRISALWPANV